MDTREKDLLMLRAVEHAKHEEYDDALQVIDQILDEEPDDYLTLFNKAFTLRIAGRTGEAEQLFGSLLDLMPGSAGVHHQLGSLLSGRGAFDRALPHFIRVTEITPLAAESWRELGATLSALKRFPEAKEALRKGSVFAPDNEDILVQLSQCYLKEGDIPEAIRSLDHALEIHPGAELVLYHKARIYESQGDREKEISCYDELIRNHPENIFAWLKKGLALMLNEEYDLSLRCFSLASRLEDPGHMPFLLKGLVFSLMDRVQEAVDCFEEAYVRSPGDPDISLHLGKALGSADRHEEALAAFERVLDIKPAIPEALEGKARALYHLHRWEELCSVCTQLRTDTPANPIGYLLEAQVRGWHTGDPESALSILRDGIFHIPSNEHLLCLMIDLLEEMGQSERALVILNSEMDEHRESVPILYRLSTLHTHRGDFGSASRFLDLINQIQPEDAQILYLAGEAYEHLGDPETALKRYTSAVTHNPRDSKGWLGRARTLLDLGNPQDALRSARQATSLSDDWYDAWLCQARAEIETGKLENARKTCTYITMSQPDNPEGWKSLGDVMLRLKEGHASCMAYTRALSVDPSDHEARDGKIRSLLCIGDFETALTEYDAALTLKGENFPDLFGKGMVLIDTGRIEAARACLTCSLPYAEHDAEALFNLANAWSALNEFSLSDRLYQRSLDLDPDNNRVWSMRGQTLRDAGNHETAVICFDHALELDPDDYESFQSREASLNIIRERNISSHQGKNHESILKSGE